jgi:hypothetical protein
MCTRFHYGAFGLTPVWRLNVSVKLFKVLLYKRRNDFEFTCYLINTALALKDWLGRKF